MKSPRISPDPEFENRGTILLDAHASEVETERELVPMLEGTNKIPVGRLAPAGGDRIQTTACILSIDDREKHVAISGSTNNGVILAREIADELIAKES